MTLDDCILGIRLRVIRRAQELGNVSAACRELGISRTLFYGWRKRFERYGPDGLHPRRRQTRQGRPPQVPPHGERLVVGCAPAWPTCGCGRLAAHSAHHGWARLSPSTVQRILRRAGLPTRRERLGVREARSAPERGAAHGAHPPGALPRPRGGARHGEANTPGERVCLDTLYLGKIKGVGPVWQFPALSAQASAAFLREVRVPLSRRAGWPLRWVRTDRGSEFKGAFDATRRTLGIRHPRARPRHAWTNGFVDRLQGTVLQEHWRVQFRRRYFTSRAAMAQSLRAFLWFSNTQRPHSGYRLRGQTPAALFWAAAQDWPRKLMNASGNVKLWTPFRVWTP